jgi:hypothetical protein
MVEESEQVSVQFSDNNSICEEASEDYNEYESESVDPRVQIELERLNKASSDINKIENELEVILNTKILDLAFESVQTRSIRIPKFRIINLNLQ